VFDAVARFLARAVADGPVVVLVDDLQWADPSTVDLLRYLAGTAVPGALLLVGAYRPEGAATLASIATLAEPVVLRGLSEAEVSELVMAIAPAAADLAALVHQRSGGHPFFARELAQVLTTPGATDAVPAAIREVIARRLARVSTGCARVLEAAAVAGPHLLPDVLADVTGTGPAGVAEHLREAVAADLVAADRFGHDLYREAIVASLPPARRLDLHQRVAVALVARHERGGQVFPAEVARHFAAAVPVAGAAPALAWAHRAAEAEVARYAFVEAAGHLARARIAVADAGVPLDEVALVDLLVAEADALRRAGDSSGARQRLDDAWARAGAAGDSAAIGDVALGFDALGARFAMRRADLVDVLDRARQALADAGTPIEAKVTAALARVLQHSVPADRPRAGPLARRAVAIARTLDDPATLASSLLAEHDSLWTPGMAAERAPIAAEITRLARQAGDAEGYAQGLLLTATAELEAGSPAFRATLAEYRQVTADLREPRHDYLLRTREAALALLDGDIEAGDRLSAEAAVLGEAVGDTDTGNVRMSQLLEVARARGEPAQLREVAAAAVRWWVSAPAHSHAVAAGFLARAGDLEAARHEVDIVLALPDWRTDRSYLWSVFVGELVTAAIALDDKPLCARLLDDVLPIAESCAVNGAVVCFMGAHAHRAGLLHAALGQREPARQWLRHALDTHRRLGARAWESETLAALHQLGSRTPPLKRSGAGPVLRREGEMWRVEYEGRSAHVRDAKGLHDLAALLRRPGTDVPAVELAGGIAAGTDPVLDRAALTAYRRRLSELDDEVAGEREAVLGELRRATRPDGRSRALGNTDVERARKAVTARIRDAIRRIEQVLPDLGTHLDRTVRTGNTCRYDP
jgi:hypothetical protein